ncbi:MAG: hypothetical protein KGZ85_16105 [Ignavibacterium sp.]|nr:hypothetical protein [Ignavibacterium sp.]
MKQEKKNIIKSSLFVAMFFIVIAISISFITSGRVNDVSENQITESYNTLTDIIDENCEFNGMKLYGKIQFVTSFPDIKIKVVESFPDLKVKIVDAFPDDCGEWQIVNSFPDLKVQIVESFPDIKIKFVEAFPGLP